MRIKKLLIAVLIFFLFTAPVQAELGGFVGAEYSSIREKFNWQVGLNYTYEDVFKVGFELHNWTEGLRSRTSAPFIGFTSHSVDYHWKAEIYPVEGITVYVNRHCQHWFEQVDKYKDYAGIRAGVKYEF